jgi:hypothetical protein
MDNVSIRQMEMKQLELCSPCSLPGKTVIKRWESAEGNHY